MRHLNFQRLFFSRVSGALVEERPSGPRKEALPLLPVNAVSAHGVEQAFMCKGCHETEYLYAGS